MTSISWHIAGSLLNVLCVVDSAQRTRINKIYGDKDEWFQYL
jgi:hypothetical protein